MSLIYHLLKLLFQVVAVVVTLSYFLAWYENANQNPKLIAARFTPRSLLLALWLILLETGLLSVTVLVNPFGWLHTGQTTASPQQQTPILLLHGLFHNRACWWFVKLRLRLHGYHNLHTLNLPPWKDAESLTELIALRVDALRHAIGGEKVILVGHSMGGILARNYLQRRGGADKVAKLILLGAPNQGSKLIPFAVTRLARVLLPNSEFLQRLNQADFPAGIPVTNIYTRHDNMVVPSSNCKLRSVAEVELETLGHIALLYHPKALNALTAALKEEP